MDSFYAIMDVNYFGCVRMTKAVVPHMRAKRSGKILQISSILGFKGNLKTSRRDYSHVSINLVDPFDLHLQNRY